jgi:hypothetical protein
MAGCIVKVSCAILLDAISCACMCIVKSGTLHADIKDPGGGRLLVGLLRQSARSGLWGEDAWE